MPPGERWPYSNAGNKTLGLVLEAVTEKPYTKVVRERLLAPLGMDALSGAIVHETRRVAVDRDPFHDDRPWQPTHGLAPATWLETSAGAGCLAATAADLAQRLRMLLNAGAGRQGRIPPPASFARITAPHVESSRGATSGHGIETAEHDGWRGLGHDGGMIDSLSTTIGDPDAGVGVVAPTNGIAGVEDIARFVLRAVVATHAGEPLPAPPGVPLLPLADDAGTFRGDTGDFVVESAGARLTRRRDGEIVPPVAPLHRSIPAGFLADHPAFARFLVRFGRDDAGNVVDVTHGADVWAREGHDLAPAPEPPAEWVAYPGHYRRYNCYNPWLSSFRVVPRRGELVLVYPFGPGRALIAVAQNVDPRRPRPG